MSGTRRLLHPECRARFVQPSDPQPIDERPQCATDVIRGDLTPDRFAVDLQVSDDASGVLDEPHGGESRTTSARPRGPSFRVAAMRPSTSCASRRRKMS